MVHKQSNAHIQKTKNKYKKINKPRHRPYNLHKKWVKMDKRSKCKMHNYKTSRGSFEKIFVILGLYMCFEI